MLFPRIATAKPDPNLAKSSQIGQSLLKDDPRKPPGFPWIFLVRFEPFQGLARTPWP
jgi:hypothetical protein